ncbi:MAG: tRNA (N6-isopentenyl adenosine(37)-C2)-methylthiotransferase MiaB [Clostridia bacterium]|nr:tRNA (N6-isopentenyl adenosine(37)-C2)-methylthiotransferase MiaB [Clostridia bacterium]
MKTAEVAREEILRQHEIALSLRPALTGRKAMVRTFGCQQNEADGERIAGQLADCGYEITEDLSEADLVVLNTCAVREHAENRVLGIIGSMKKEKEKRPEMKIGMCGCMAQEPHRQEQLKKNYPFVDFLFGTDRIHRIPEMVREILGRRGQRQFVTELPHAEFGVIAEETPVVRTSSYRALVSVRYVCNNFCSYCIVPYVRGRERSRRPESVLTEVRGLVESGCRDIMLLGQNVNSYRGERPGSEPPERFPELLSECASMEGDYWIRFMTSHPKDASEELFRAMATHPRVADHLHLPFQSGSDRILKEMRRGYTRETYLEKTDMIRRILPGAALTSDVIVGFPTETEKEFLDTVDLVRKVRFDMLYMFLYSPRRGTDAAAMDGRIPHEEQVRRFEYLSGIQNAIAEEKNAALVGTSVRVLSDGTGEKGVCTGRTSQNKIISLDRDVPAGTFCTVSVTEAKQYTLAGKVVD